MATHWIVGITSVMFLIVAQEFGGTVMMTISLNLVICQKGFIIDRLTNPQIKKCLMMGSSKLLLVVYIRTSNLTKHSYNFFEEYNFLSKTTIMKKLSDKKKCLEVKLWLEKKLMTKYKEVFLILKTSFKVSFKKYTGRKLKGKILLVAC